MGIDEKALDKRAVNRYMPNNRHQKKFNYLIRDTADAYGVYLYQVAELLGWSIDKFTRVMRHELPEDEQQRICNMIREEYGDDRSIDC